MRLAGKVAIVTGAGQGMGRAIARLFAKEGASVVGVDLNLAAVDETIAGIDTEGRCLARKLNVAESTGVEELFREVTDRFGRIDVVVNNAGIGSVDSLVDITDETWARVTRVNLNGAFYCLREAVRSMKATGTRGSVISVSSTAALTGEGPAHYCASKAAIMGLTRSAAREMASLGIRVNTIVPGPTDTPMMKDIPEEWADAIIRNVPMGRMGTPDEVARVALFLASEDSSFVTGQNIAVNGGMTFI